MSQYLEFLRYNSKARLAQVCKLVFNFKYIFHILGENERKYPVLTL